MVPFFACSIVILPTQRFSNLSPSAVGASGQHNGAGIHGKPMRILRPGPNLFQPNFGQRAKCSGDTVQSAAKGLVTGQGWKTRQKMVFDVVIDRFPRQQLLSFAPQIDRDQLLICKLGTIVVALAL